jgi:lipopolysaccharide biosynthesis regulator YciM
LINNSQQQIQNESFDSQSLNKSVNLDEKDQITLRVGTKDFVVQRKTLTSVNGSLLATLFQNNFDKNVVNSNRVVLNRDPEVFEHVLKYLENPKSPMSSNNQQSTKLTEEMSDKVEKELMYWKIKRSDIGGDARDTAKSLVNSAPTAMETARTIDHRD